MNELLKDSPNHVKYSMARHWVMGVALEHHIRANKKLKNLHDCELITEDIADLGLDCLSNLSGEWINQLLDDVSLQAEFDREQLRKIILEPDTL